MLTNFLYFIRDLTSYVFSVYFEGNYDSTNRFNNMTTFIKNECEGFIRGSKHLERGESSRSYAECFYCFQVFGTLDETRSTSF